MQYIAEIASIQGDTIKVVITTPATGTDKELVLTADAPVVIDYEQDDVFKPLKMSACSVKILTEQPLLDIYTGTLNQVTLHVYRNNTLIWFGFLTPNVYTSSYEDVWDELTLEFVDPLSAMENVKYKRVNSNQWRSFRQFISGALAATYSGYTIVVPLGVDIDTLGCMERNFIDETDDDNEAMTQQEVVEEIAKYLRLQAVMDGKTLRFIDPIAQRTATSISNIGLAEGGANISLGSVYNQVTVVENTNPMDGDDVLDSELLTDGNMQSIMWESLENPYYDFSVGAYNVYLDYDGGSTDLRALYRPKAASGWWMLGKTPIMATAEDNWQLATRSVVDGNYNFIEKGAFVLYSCSYKNSDVPSKLSFKKSIMMFHDIRNADGTISIYRDIQSTPFLGYKKPSQNIVIKGGFLVLALKYKYLSAPMTEIERNIILPHEWRNKEIKYFYFSYNDKRGKGPELDAYGRDFFKVKLKIGNKYWNGSVWTTTESTFMIQHTWKGSENRFNTEASLDNTNTYLKKLGNDIEGYAIPVSSDGLFGSVEFELCPPSCLGKSNTTDTYVATTIGCCEITELKLAYCPQKKDEESLVLDTDTEDTDIKVTGTMDVANIFSLDDIELKINTWSDLQNSYSYVIKNANNQMTFHVPSPKPEVAIINRNIEYYSKPRIQFGCTLQDNPSAHLTPWQNYTVPAFDGKQFTTGQISYDLRENSAQVTLLEIPTED